ncbi:MAG: hypothetical protein IJV17_04350 [Prevotella sp.]|nr:hypothetical protein [Prevotella sp.]
MIVIADDITGAAEMAGIAHSHGLPVRLCCSPLCCDTVAAEGTAAATVIATDTRSMTEEEAVAETQRIASHLPKQGGAGGESLFKKTDSALRGHVVAELSALMKVMGYQRTVYLPANPSKGRIIRAGTYYIIKEGREIPISETAFSYDPEFPATTSILKERFPDAAQKGILMPDAESKEDIQRIIADYDDGKTLFAGAADLFEAWLIGTTRITRDTKNTRPSRETKSPLTSTLLLCGSTQSKPLALGIPVTEMPRAIYDGSKDITSWQEQAYSVYEQQGSLMITIPFHHRTGKEVAVHLREMTATLIQHLVEKRQPQQLIIEGGASAFATLQHLGWSELEMVSQIAPGVIKTKAPNGTFVIMKPGSYSWGSLF